MVHLEHADPVVRERVPVGEGVEARAEHDDLTGSVDHVSGEGVLGDPVAHRDEDPHRCPARRGPGVVHHAVGVVAQDPQGQRVAEDPPVLEDLVGGSVPGGAPGRAARSSVLHARQSRRGVWTEPWQHPAATVVMDPSRDRAVVHTGRVVADAFDLVQT
jgi:hypothetical protein